MARLSSYTVYSKVINSNDPNRFFIPIIDDANINPFNVLKNDKGQSRAKFFDSNGKLVGTVLKIINMKNGQFVAECTANDDTQKGLEAIADLNFYQSNGMGFKVSIVGNDVVRIDINHSHKYNFNLLEDGKN